MTLSQSLKVMREKWAYMLAGALIASFVAVVLQLALPTQYTARTTMYISAQTPGDPTAAYEGGLLSQQRAISYVELLGSPRVGQAVLDRTRLPVPLDTLLDSITASSKTDSVLLDVQVSSADPRAALDVANTLNDVFPETVSALERPARPNQTPPVIVRAVQAAYLSNDVWPPSLLLTLPVLFLMGLFLGFCAALVVDRLDTRIRGSDDLARSTGKPVYGEMVQDKSAAAIGPAKLGGNTPYTEALRLLRTNLAFANVDDPPRVVLVTSSLPGEGKTATASGLASVMAAANSRVLLIDADLRRPAAARLLSLTQDVGLSTVLAGRASLADSVQVSAVPGLSFLASGQSPPNPSELLGSLQMTGLLDSARTMFDFVVVDSPPVLPVVDSLALSRVVDSVLLLARRGKTSASQVSEAAEALSAVGAPLAGCVLTFAERKRSEYHGYYARGGTHTLAEAAESSETDKFSRAGLARTSRRTPSPHARGRM